MSPSRLVWRLGLLAWSTGIVALALSHRAPADVTSMEPGATPDGLRRPISAVEEAALVVLRQADVLMESRVGYAGAVPDEVLAWRALRSSPRAPDLFRQLLATAALPGRLYALAGLRTVDRKAFEQGMSEAAGWLLPDIMTARGCILQEEPVVAVLAEIRAGKWSRELAGARLRLRTHD